MGAVSDVRGMSAAIAQAQAGMKLFEATNTAAAELDVAGAEQYKAEIEGRIAALDAEAAKLSGKDNKKERTAKGKEAADLKVEQRYVDACKVAKGLEPKFGNFVTKPSPAPVVEQPTMAEEPKKEVKEAKRETKPKKEEVGLTAVETKELENLKQAIMERKAILKEQGMSGGQQNKDAEVVKMVDRMNELKEKQEPGSTKKDAKKEGGKKSRAPLSAEEQKELSKLQGEIEAYKNKLKKEFGYSNKDMKNDPDLVEMESRLAELEKREG